MGIELMQLFWIKTYYTCQKYDMWVGYVNMFNNNVYTVYQKQNELKMIF